MWISADPSSNVIMPLENEFEKYQIWPSSVNSSFALSDWTCGLSNYSLVCPSSGLPIILDWLQNWRTSALETTLPFQHNDLRRILSIQQTDGFSASSEATTPSDVVLVLLTTSGHTSRRARMLAQFTTPPNHCSTHRMITPYFKHLLAPIV